jgi:hypothetical protein
MIFFSDRTILGIRAKVTKKTFILNCTAPLYLTAQMARTKAMVIAKAMARRTYLLLASGPRPRQKKDRTRIVATGKTIEYGGEKRPSIRVSDLRCVYLLIVVSVT